MREKSSVCLSIHLYIYYILCANSKNIRIPNCKTHILFLSFLYMHSVIFVSSVFFLFLSILRFPFFIASICGIIFDHLYMREISQKTYNDLRRFMAIMSESLRTAVLTKGTNMIVYHRVCVYMCI